MSTFHRSYIKLILYCHSTPEALRATMPVATWHLCIPKEKSGSGMPGVVL